MHAWDYRFATTWRGKKQRSFWFVCSNAASVEYATTPLGNIREFRSQAAAKAFAAKLNAEFERRKGDRTA